MLAFWLIKKKHLQIKSSNRNFETILFSILEALILNLTENFWRGNVFFTLEGTQFYPFFFLILHQNRKITDFPRIEICKILHFFFGGHKMLSNYEKLRMKAWIVFIQSKLKVFWRKYFFFLQVFFLFWISTKILEKKKSKNLKW